MQKLRDAICGKSGKNLEDLTHMTGMQSFFFFKVLQSTVSYSLLFCKATHVCIYVCLSVFLIVSPFFQILPFCNLSPINLSCLITAEMTRTHFCCYEVHLYVRLWVCLWAHKLDYTV